MQPAVTPPISMPFKPYTPGTTAQNQRVGEPVSSTTPSNSVPQGKNSVDNVKTQPASDHVTGNSLGAASNTQPPTSQWKSASASTVDTSPVESK